jgi:glycosyltransferase involved in cell wall biosynthesis
MRILKVVQFYYPFEEMGGPVVKVRALAQALAKRGHAVTVLTADWGVCSRNGHGLALDQCPWGWRATEQNVETIYLSSVARYRALTLNPRVIGFCGVSLNGFDLVHFYGLYDLLGPAVGFYCRRASLPYVIEPLGMYRPIDRSLLRKAVWHRSVGRAFCDGARSLIATAELERQTLLEEGISPRKIVVRYNGVDSDIADAAKNAEGRFRRRWAIPPGEPIILFLSRLIPRKGADILIDAFARCCQRSARLVIAGPEGEPGYRSQLQDHARNSGAGERVIFAGPLYGEDKAAALADADLFVLPSRYENFANVAAEAMTCGVPVIVSDACGISSLVQGKAGLVIPPRIESLVGALRQMFGDSELYARFKAGCREVADQLSWDALAAQMESYYARWRVDCLPGMVCAETKSLKSP